MTTLAAAQRLTAQPYSTASGHYSLALSTSDAELTLPAGAYRLVNDSAVPAVVCLGAAASDLPGATRHAGQFVIPAGGTVNVAWDGTLDGKLHALTRSSTGVLDVMSLGAL